MLLPLLPLVTIRLIRLWQEGGGLLRPGCRGSRIHRRDAVDTSQCHGPVMYLVVGSCIHTTPLEALPSGLSSGCTSASVEFEPVASCISRRRLIPARQSPVLTLGPIEEVGCEPLHRGHFV